MKTPGVNGSEGVADTGRTTPPLPTPTPPFAAAAAISANRVACNNRSACAKFLIIHRMSPESVSSTNASGCSYSGSFDHVCTGTCTICGERGTCGGVDGVVIVDEAEGEAGCTEEVEEGREGGNWRSGEDGEAEETEAA